MIALSQAFAKALDAEGLPVFAKAQGYTKSHQFAIEAARFGGGQTASKQLREAGFLACGIGLPIGPVEGDMNGLRIGTPELVAMGCYGGQNRRDRIVNCAGIGLQWPR